MKNYLYLIAIVSLQAIVLTQCVTLSTTQKIRPKLTDSKIRKVEFVEMGTMAVPNEVCCLEFQADGRYLAKYGQFGKVDSVFCGQDVADKIYDCLKRGEIDKYKSHYSPKVHVLDGHSWSFMVELLDRTVIGSGGYMAYPKDFSAVAETCHVIKSLFGK